MKYLTLLLIIFLSSCNNLDLEKDKALPFNKEKVTTIELQNKLNVDTNLYNIVIQDSELYAINTKNKMVEYRVEDHSGALLTSIVFLIIIIVLLLITIGMLND